MHIAIASTLKVGCIFTITQDTLQIVSYVCSTKFAVVIGE